MGIFDLERESESAVTNLGRLVARLALDEDLFKRFCENPDPIIAEAGLSEEEAEALKNGNWDVIKAHLGPKPRNITKTGGS